MAAAILTHARLHQILHYEPETGVFRWKEKMSEGTDIGDAAGSAHSGGYWRIQIGGRKYLANRLAWFYVKGEWPAYGVDHRDGDGQNNRWANLRDLPQALNTQNQRRARSDNRSGLIGAHRQHRGPGFTSTIIVGGKRMHLGSFKTAEEAHAAYISAKRRLHPACTI